MPDDYQIARRLDAALEADARRSPLPFGFAASVAASLEDRSARRSNWFSGMPAIAAVVVLAIIAVAVPLSLTPPSMTPGPGTSEATEQSPSFGASASPSPAGATTAPTVGASPQALTEAEAVQAALNADGRPGMSAANAEFGPASQVLPREGFEWADVPSGDTWVWLIVVSDDGPPLGQEGSFVVLDYFDGTIYGVQRWIS